MFNYSQKTFSSSVASSSSIDIGLRSYMVKVYNQMTIALGISGFIAFIVANTPLMQIIFGNKILMWVAVLSPLAFVIFFSLKLASISAQTAKNYLWIYASLMGISLASLFAIYTGVSITRVFFITAATIWAISLYGYTTKKDLTNFGSFLMMGLIGIIIASLINIFLKSSAMHFAISIIGTLIFIGLTAYDVQKIKQQYYMVSGNDEMIAKASVVGALSLYMDFINLFIHLMQLMGQRRGE